MSQYQHLPRQADVLKLAQQAIELSGTVKLADLPRLRELLENDSGEVTVVLNFAQDEDRNRVVTGSVEAQLEVLCQRCLQSMTQHVATTLSLAFVWDDIQAKALPRHLDPVMLEDESGYLDLYAVIEDELLLSLPITSLHEECASGEDGTPRQFGDIEESGTDVTENPFSALEQVKNDLKKTR